VSPSGGSSRWRALGLACAAAFVSAVPASAHLVTTGLGPVYDGISHLLVSFDDLLPALTLALLAGLNGPAAGRRALFVLPIAWLGAGFAGHALRMAPLPGAVAALSLLVVGLLTALDRRLPPSAVAALAAAVGALHGWSNGAALALDGREARALLGIGAALFVIVALVAALVCRLKQPWTRIAVRVAGSWAAAIGLLMIGWALR
jgi:hydrogenase/urease accessory protein HupE